MHRNETGLSALMSSTAQSLSHWITEPVLTDALLRNLRVLNFL
ncbi:hypothetical protein LEP1GSC016_4122 [Leptospira borgpetersenii serovar Hardjo-bovis str. Sponselee]|uniref:Uncharacterized protein n=6 Tax=Leptospira borgpetersenii TaxID=174 RepID=M3GBY1_LEPBO|nr:hypothetical protein LBBP_01592 [Leptospira borgpetersenii serovar Ballum]EKP12097.1 hypothetical protein LEP1GSC128_0275 [Leptospira borgpetersenii str. 200801926]EKQ90855.1 hypothetical protein LEP1GSC101_1177 [Leptospira borgpetersenii str. UI 09149]EKR00532.1 hypothetical protein LEP1GSC121_1169 [Leptospira borgpetersenii serovar Castellonis str. 200801910]EMF98416.1 hypothetical protein LEP1GSC123_1469 [Leptospira borgpetersenii str. 200701203]EMJ84702.1 hypothetical protein LEP1GSC016